MYLFMASMSAVVLTKEEVNAAVLPDYVKNVNTLPKDSPLHPDFAKAASSVKTTEDITEESKPAVKAPIFTSIQPAVTQKSPRVDEILSIAMTHTNEIKELYGIISSLLDASKENENSSELVERIVAELDALKVDNATVSTSLMNILKDNNELKVVVKQLSEYMKKTSMTQPRDKSDTDLSEKPSGLFTKVGETLDTFLDKKVIITIIILVVVYQTYIYMSNRNTE